jgi:hypothetical protein
MALIETAILISGLGFRILEVAAQILQNIDNQRFAKYELQLPKSKALLGLNKMEFNC